jgi:hypothetical protein
VWRKATTAASIVKQQEVRPPKSPHTKHQGRGTLALSTDRSNQSKPAHATTAQVRTTAEVRPPRVSTSSRLQNARPAGRDVQTSKANVRLKITTGARCTNSRRTSLKSRQQATGCGNARPRQTKCRVRNAWRKATTGCKYVSNSGGETLKSPYQATRLQKARLSETFKCQEQTRGAKPLRHACIIKTARAAKNAPRLRGRDIQRQSKRGAKSITASTHKQQEVRPPQELIPGNQGCGSSPRQETFNVHSKRVAQSHYGCMQVCTNSNR